jgi:hypothetical protein
MLRIFTGERVVFEYMVLGKLDVYKQKNRIRIALVYKNLLKMDKRHKYKT